MHDIILILKTECMKTLPIGLLRTFTVQLGEHTRAMPSWQAIDMLVDEMGYKHIVYSSAKSANYFYLAKDPEGTVKSKRFQNAAEHDYVLHKLNLRTRKNKAQQGQVIEGPSHAGGGVDVVDKHTQKPIIEVEGGETIINAQASKENCEELSKINQSAGNGIAFDCSKTGPEAQTDKAEQGAIANPMLQHGGAAMRADNAIGQNVVPQSDIHQAEFSGPSLINHSIEKLIDEKGTDPDKYTAADKELLTTYTGWGGLDIEGTGKGKEALTEFYTPDAIIRKMWALAYKYGFENGNSVLEPACGIGDFLKYVPSSSAATGIEISKYSFTIAKVLYPQFFFFNKPFEEMFIKDRNSVRGRKGMLSYFDLVIGNPPYGDVGGLYMGMGEKQYTKAKNWVEYFITRGLDVLSPGGLLIYIIGTEVANGGVPWLAQGPSKVKDEISAKADLLDAYRLPNGVFDRTDVVSDIVVFKKK